MSTVDRELARDKDKRRKREERRSPDVVIPQVADPARREFALQGVRNFCMTYGSMGSDGFEPTFTHEPTRIQLEIMEEMQRLVFISQDKAIAAPRGEGKTTSVEWAVMYGICKGLLKFVFFVAATGTHAETILADIKEQFEQNELLAADFPEICACIRELEGSTQRQQTQTVDGRRTLLHWSGSWVRFPRVSGSPASGAIIEARGLDGHIRGIKRGTLRPNLVVIEDPETEESAKSDVQIEKRRRIIDRALGASGGHSRRASRVMLCTTQNRNSLAYEYTDPIRRPSWNGVRYGWVMSMPENMGLWEQYIALRQSREDDPYARKAHAFYLLNFEEMNRGAVVSNPYRFDSTILPDQSQKEVSSLQAFFNFVADEGWDFVNTEFQNNPPIDEEIEGREITSAIVAKRVNGFEMREIPRDTEALTAYLDLGHNFCHWTAIAWRKSAIGFVVDYGIVNVQGILKDSGAGDIERCLLTAMYEWRDQLLKPYYTAEGDLKTLDMALIDSSSGLHEPAVYQFCREVGGAFHPAKGVSPFQHGKPSSDRIIGSQWYRSRQHQKRMWLYMLDADYWKRFVHERFLSPTLDDQGVFRPGTLSMFACPEQEQFRKDRREFCHQMVAELWVKRQVPGKVAKEGWEIRSSKNHWLDATAGACAAGSICGIRLMGEAKVRRPPMTLEQLAKRA